MNKTINNRINSLVLAVILSLVTSSVTFAKQTSAQENTKEKEKVEETKQNQTAEKRKQILSEATKAISRTREALKRLDEKKAKEALELLEKATGKLEIILARDPGLALAPAGVTSATYDVFTDIASINVIRDRAEDALEDGRLQEARRLIRNLASETVISITNIPLATYPSAIKLAAGSIDGGDLETAKTILQTALNTLVITESIIPLPVVHAEYKLKEAQVLAGKVERNEEENTRLKNFIADARNELKLAEALGYSSKTNFKHLYEQLDHIEEKTKEGKTDKNFFAKIKSFLKDITATSQSEKISGQK